MTTTMELRSSTGQAWSPALRQGTVPAVSRLRSSALPRILIVDASEDLRHLVADYLQEHGFETASARGRAEMAAALEANPTAMILLDPHLGRDEGLDVLRELRRRAQIPVIIVSGQRRDAADRVIGLELGADDYVTKPFSRRELLARIRTILRRRDSPVDLPDERTGSDRFEFAGWTLDRKRRQLTNPANEAVPLTKGEFSLLSAFVDAPGRPLSREFLLQATRLHEDVFDRSIDVQILRLRRKLELDPARPRLIRTERGFGYVFSARVVAGR